jgi:hypothetical protein
MQKIDLGQMIQILANIGVIAGIVFLAIELRQNSEQLELQSYQSWVAANLELNMAATDEAGSAMLARGVEDSSNLSSETFIGFAMWYMGVMQMAQATDYLYRAGSLDEELWRAEIDRAAGMLSLPGVRQWWDAGAKTQLTPSFVDLIESTQSGMSVWGWEQGRGFVTYEAPTQEPE